MKALLLLVVILVGVWLWRNRKSPGNRPDLPQSPAATKPLEMVRCTRCGVHIPSNEQIAGTQGTYCCAEHLRQSES